jgi:CRISPR-associated protein (TIGR02584 family)
MRRIFVATLGQRPEAITVALDEMLRRVRYDAVAIVHTAETSAIAESLAQLRKVFAKDYQGLLVFYHEIMLRSGKPMLDVNTQDTATDYFYGVFEVLKHYWQQGDRQHLLISGGRKAMSAYAMIAASYVFNHEDDRVLVVVSDERLTANHGQFHVEPGMRDQVQIVYLPLQPARLAPGSDPAELFDRWLPMREKFLAKLSAAERELCEVFQSYQYADNKELGEYLSKSERTVAKQLENIYKKMDGFFDTTLPKDKRSILRDILRGG